LIASGRVGMMGGRMNTAVKLSPNDDALAQARRVVEAERDALDALARRLDSRVNDAVRLLLECRGKVVLGGLGKCAPIAQKIAATFSSTGTPAVFVHPADATHGDIGVVQATDAAILLSNSGETAETVALARMLRERGVKSVAFTGRAISSLARLCDVVLDTGVTDEGDPLGAAPMASTTAMLALGDALAAALMQARGFTERDYAALHPGGTLGLRLTSRVADLMHAGAAVPRTRPDTTVREALLEMSAKGLGTLFVVEPDDRLSGVVTDGDLRRLFQREPDPLARRVREAMTTAPRTIGAEALAIEALRAMERERPVTCLAVVTADGRITGALHIHDLIRAGIA
jgi:arabinose-5-phosphate isomerase